ncbi:potassium-transporting ATPase B chain [Striga asiatica]|uniref:Potassium-transporting ATPase B chain n=1 Tax=Striga asiatica TaxID=4170 RepID=A0A5A7R065_STRAF|nr:potassium-transporting ATPase B chain [Striga asiatica]
MRAARAGRPAQAIERTQPLRQIQKERIQMATNEAERSEGRVRKKIEFEPQQMVHLLMGERRGLNPRVVDSQSTALIHLATSALTPAHKTFPIALTSSPGLSIPNVNVVEFSTGSRPLTVDLASHYSSSAGMVLVSDPTSPLLLVSLNKMPILIPLRTSSLLPHWGFGRTPFARVTHWTDSTPFFVAELRSFPLFRTQNKSYSYLLKRAADRRKNFPLQEQ